MQKTVKQICEEQGILGQIILDRWNSAHNGINTDFITDKPFFMHIVDFGNWNDQPEPNWFWNTVFDIIREKELKPKSLAEQFIESSGLKESVEKMQVLAEQPSKLAKEIMNSFEGVSIEPTKNISKGSIVTIDGKEYELQGDAVLVEPIKELIQGKRYLIKYSGKLCHSKGEIDKEMLKIKPVSAIFIGEITLSNKARRNIFYRQEGIGTYFMFSTELDYIIKQLD